MMFYYFLFINGPVIIYRLGRGGGGGGFGGFDGFGVKQGEI